jgi:hypothetical protein
MSTVKHESTHLCGLPVVVEFGRTDTGQLVVTEIAVDVSEAWDGIYEGYTDNDQPEPTDEHREAIDEVVEEFRAFVRVVLTPGQNPVVRSGMGPDPKVA